MKSLGFFPKNCVLLRPYRQCWRRAANDKFVNRAALDAFRTTREREELVLVIRGGVGVWMSKKSFYRSSSLQLSRSLASRLPHLSLPYSSFSPSPSSSSLPHIFFLSFSLFPLCRLAPLFLTESNSYRGSVLSPGSALLSVSFLPWVVRARPFVKIGFRVVQPLGPTASRNRKNRRCVRNKTTSLCILDSHRTGESHCSSCTIDCQGKLI